MSKKSDKPYIVIAQQEWALNLGSNARNLAMEFSRSGPVMYINPAMDVRSIFKQINTKHGKQRLKLAMGLGQNTERVADNLWVHTPSTISYSINWIKNITAYNVLNRRNAKGFFNSVKKAIGKLGWDKKKCVVFNDSQMFTGQYTKKILEPLLNFYYIRDNLIEHPYFKFHGTRIEPLTISEADAVFANSAYLADYAKQHHSISMNIGQGCELDMYDPEKKYAVPEDMEAIPHPRIGYAGFLTGIRLDIPLLEELAQTKPGWSFVLIGPEEEMFQQSRLHQLPNVYFLGGKRSDQLPAYIQHLDVCLNPQLINPLTIGNYPRKIDEYLAMGKPTVATDTPAMKMFLPHVQLAIGITGYCNAIKEALQHQQNKKRTESIAFARSHTWQACVDKILSIQNQLANA